VPDWISLSQELHTKVLLLMHIPIKYRWQNIGLPIEKNDGNSHLRDFMSQNDVAVKPSAQNNYDLLATKFIKL
ncbi:MAG: hypothetical protein PVH88_27210, partial [Ignavibacteria bacterium]